MKASRDIITAHSQTDLSASCAAWGIEVALLVFGKPLPSPSIQKASPECGFGDAIRERLRKEFGLVSWQKAYNEDFGALERESLVELRDGAVALVTLPSRVVYDAATRTTYETYHTYVIYEHANGLHFGTRSGQDQPEQISAKDFDARRLGWANMLKGYGASTDGMLHVLFVKPTK